MQAKGRWGKSGGESGAPGWGTQTSTVGEKQKKKKKKKKGRDQGTTRETAEKKLESLFSVLCLHRTRIPNPTGFFPSSKKAGPHFIGFEAHGGAAVARDGGSSPMQLSFPKKG
jgi:hypothetical protein